MSFTKVVAVVLVPVLKVAVVLPNQGRLQSQRRVGGVLPHSLTSTELERTTTKGMGRKQMPKGEENKVRELVHGH